MDRLEWCFVGVIVLYIGGRFVWEVFICDRAHRWYHEHSGALPKRLPWYVWLFNWANK